MALPSANRPKGPDAPKGGRLAAWAWPPLSCAIACAIAAGLAGANSQAWIAALAAFFGAAASGAFAHAQARKQAALDRDPEPAQRRGGETPSPEDHALFSALVEALPDPVLLIAKDARIVAANERARRLLGFAGYGQRLSAIVRHPELLEAARLAAIGAPPREVDFTTTSATPESYKAFFAPIKGLEAPSALIALHDETLIVQSERMRGEFLANASHEMRTPLATLTLLIETILGPARDDPAKREEFLRMMQVQADRMRRLIDDLLSLSKIELNEHVPPAERADLAAVAREVADTLAPLARERNVHVRLNVLSDPIYVLGDRFQLAQVVQNLADNAIKYSPSGADVVIELGGGCSHEQAQDQAGRRWPEAARMTLASAPSGAGGRRFAFLRVTDSGPGIARRHLPRLAERFYRVERDQTHERMGTGLGLAIVKHILNRHRGAFVVESVLGAGSAFGLILSEESAPKGIENPPDAALSVSGPGPGEHNWSPSE